MRRAFQKYAARTVLMISFAAVLFNPSVGLAGLLGSAQSFAVLGGETVTNTGLTTVTGNIGIDPGSSYTDNGTLTQTGVKHFADAAALQAQSDVTTAYNLLALMGVNQDLSGTDLGGLTLLPGVYRFSSSAQLTGILTLNALGNPNAQFVFLIGSTLTTASGSTVDVINGGAGNGVFWDVGSSATLGTTTAFQGNILAFSSITLNTGASLCGRALAENAAVTLDTNTIADTCGADFGSQGFAGVTGVTGSGVPEPGTVSLLAVGLLALCGWRKRVS